MQTKLCKTLFSLFFILFSITLTGCTPQTEAVSKTGFYFDTTATITLYENDDAARETLFQGCFALCKSYEELLSRTIPDSDIWKINHAKGAPVVVSEETATLLTLALSYCSDTNGAVDITIAPLSSLWDFSSEDLENKAEHTIPSEEQRKEALSHVDYRKVIVDGNTVTLPDPDAAIDLGCVAKGFIADRLKEYLVKNDCKSAIINLGGNIVTVGARLDGTPFQIGIQNPEGGNPIAILPITDASLVSSGTYQRCFEKDGILYHHLLSTKTGMPIQNGLRSVTILSASSADGDMLSTACFLLGLTDGMAYVESLPGIEAVFITEDHVLHTSSGLSSLLQTP